MISKKIEKELNNQIVIEAESSFHYLAMASWCDNAGFEGAAKFLYGHSEEERQHMLKLFRYINDAGGHALSPAIGKVPHTFKNLKNVFEVVLKHEKLVTQSINNLVDICLKEKDHSTFNFIQWYVGEQHEEERLFMSVLDKFKIVGDDGKGLYWIDKELGELQIGGHEGMVEGESV